MKTEFPDIDAIADRWLSCWRVSENIYSKLPKQEQLDRAVLVFMAQELDDDDDEHPKPAVIAATVAAMNRAKTHSKEAITKATKRAFNVKDPAFFDRADTRSKRISLVAFPFLFVIASYLVVRDTDWFYSFSELRIITMLFIVSAIVSPALALTKLSDWINGTR